MHFIAHYKDEIVHGKPLGEPDTGWNNLTDKPIHKLEYVNPYGDNVVLEGCAEYNHFIEAIQQMGGKPYLTRVFLMGSGIDAISCVCTVHEIMLDEAHLGQVVTKECKRGTEYNGEPSWGWRKGIISGD